jgi:type I restriction enzyme S subunit
MSKLEQLINEFCPDGVEYVSLWEVTIWDKRFNSVDREKQPIIISYPYLLAADLFKLEQSTGDVFLLSTGKKTGWTTEELASNYLCNGEVVSIPWGKSRPVKEVLKYYKGKFVTADNRIATSNDTTKLLNKYLYYWMLNNGEIIDRFYRGSGIKHPNMNDVLNMQIPLPPLPVQEEIVRILDNLEELTTELTVELTAELNARKQQYEHYRDELFGKDYDEMINRCLKNNIDVVTLEELGSFTRGKRFVRDDIRDEGTPCIHYGDLYTYYGISAEKTKYFLDEKLFEKMRFAHKGDVVIVQAGENDMDIGIGVAWMGDEDVAVHDACYIFKHSINPKYISHYLRTSIYHLQIKKYVSTGKICAISAQGIGKAKIPVPPLPEQQRIVEILDNFDALCNDISKRLQAEIKARQQQYEYYRDKLLTFKEKEGMQDE